MVQFFLLKHRSEERICITIAFGEKTKKTIKKHHSLSEIWIFVAKQSSPSEKQANKKTNKQTNKQKQWQQISPAEKKLKAKIFVYLDIYKAKTREINPFKV